MTHTRIQKALLTTTGPRGAEPSLPYAQPLEEAGFAVDQVVIPEGSSLRQVLWALRIGPRIRNYDLVVANEYTTAFALGALACLFEARARMVVIGLNLSRKPFTLRSLATQAVINRAFQRYDAIIVHSSPEIESFSSLHNLDSRRFRLVQWGFDLPAFERANLAHLPQDYVCMVGRNNRDFRTAAQALEGAGIGGVFVGTGNNFGNQLIHCLESLPFDACLNVMANAFANLILLENDKRGAGHITAVSSMLLGKPQIFSDVPTLSEYIKDRKEGIAVPLQDVAAVRQAVLNLRSDSHLAKAMGNEGRLRAAREMSHSRFLGQILAVLLG